MFNAHIFDLTTINVTEFKSWFHDMAPKGARYCWMQRVGNGTKDLNAEVAHAKDLFTKMVDGRKVTTMLYTGKDINERVGYLAIVGASVSTTYILQYA